MDKQLIGICGPSKGGKSSMCKGLIDIDPVTYAVVSFADYLKEVALERGWSGQKDDAGRKFLQTVSEALKQEHGESVFYDVGVLKALQLPQPVILFDDARFLVEISGLFADHETWTGSCFVFEEPEAERLWEDKAMSTLPEHESAKHRSETEHRAVRDVIARAFPTFRNDKSTGLAISINRFHNHVQEHINIINGVTP